MIRNRLPIAGARRADCLKLSELTTNFKNFHQKFSARRGALCRLCANIQPDLIMFRVVARRPDVGRRLRLPMATQAYV
jgi:hypothetical protein